MFVLIRCHPIYSRLSLSRIPRNFWNPYLDISNLQELFLLFSTILFLPVVRFSCLGRDQIFTLRFCLFVLRFYGPVNPMGSCRARPVYLTTRLLDRLSPLTTIVHILSPETNNSSSLISGRERMTVENISWSISTKECCRPRRGLNPRPPGLQSDGASNWITEAGFYFEISGYSR